MNTTRIALTFCLLASFVGTSIAAEHRSEVREDWKRQYDVMTANGAIRPTEEPLRLLAAHPQATQPLPGDRTPADVVLRRIKALLDDLRETRAPAHETLMAEWSSLAKEISAGDGSGYPLYEKACQLRRKVVAAHPLCRIEAIDLCPCGRTLVLSRLP